MTSPQTFFQRFSSAFGLVCACSLTAVALSGCGGASSSSAGVTAARNTTADSTSVAVPTPVAPVVVATPAPVATPTPAATPAPVVVPTDPTGPLTPSEAVYPTDLPVCRSAYSPSYIDKMDHLLRWSGLPVRVQFASTTRFGDSGKTVEDQIRAGMNQWATVSQGAITWAEAGAENADVTVVVDHVATKPGIGQELGVTRTTWMGTDHLTQATITIHVWDGMTQGDFDRLVITGAHEFGHALGIDGHSTDPADIMFASNSGTQSITSRDLNTIWSLYCGFSTTASRAAHSSTNSAEIHTKTIQ